MIKETFLPLKNTAIQKKEKIFFKDSDHLPELIVRRSLSLLQQKLQARLVVNEKGLLQEDQRCMQSVFRWLNGDSYEKTIFAIKRIWDSAEFLLDNNKIHDRGSLLCLMERGLEGIQAQRNFYKSEKKLDKSKQFEELYRYCRGVLYRVKSIERLSPLSLSYNTESSSYSSDSEDDSICCLPHQRIASSSNLYALTAYSGQSG